MDKTRMKTAQATPPIFRNRQVFLDWVKAVNPKADLVSVMLFGLLHRASSQLIHIAEKRLEATGLTWPQFRLLMNLMHGEQQDCAAGMMPSELSERQNISRNTASALISSLEAKGFITRELDGSDRRKFLIRLTPKGSKMLHAQLEGHFNFIGELFASLNTEERHALRELLLKLNEGLKAKAK